MRPGLPTRVRRRTPRPAVDSLPLRNQYKYPYGAVCQAPSSPWVAVLDKHTVNGLNFCPGWVARCDLRLVGSVAARLSAYRLRDHKTDDAKLKHVN